MDIISVGVGIVIGWIAGRFLLTYQIIKHADHMLKKPLETMMRGSVRSETSILYTTVTDKYVYLYDKKTEEFICQASTLEEAVSKAYTLGLLKLVTIIEHGESLVLVHKGTIVEEVKDES